MDHLSWGRPKNQAHLMLDASETQPASAASMLDAFSWDFDLMRLPVLARTDPSVLDLRANSARAGSERPAQKPIDVPESAKDPPGPTACEGSSTPIRWREILPLRRDSLKCHVTANRSHSPGPESYENQRHSMCLKMCVLLWPVLLVLWVPFGAMKKGFQKGEHLFGCEFQAPFGGHQFLGGDKKAQPLLRRFPLSNS